MYRGFKKSDPLLPVEKPVTGHRYHVAWGRSHGVVGVCRSVDEASKTVILKNPKTKTKWANPVKWSDLRHTRKMQLKIKHQNPQ